MYDTIFCIIVNDNGVKGASFYQWVHQRDAGGIGCWALMRWYSANNMYFTNGTSNNVVTIA
ncbi:MAG: hypothetical protein GY765_05580 [bacterium]|nr:hypothetical protein [bacterium]